LTITIFMDARISKPLAGKNSLKILPNIF